MPRAAGVGEGGQGVAAVGGSVDDVVGGQVDVRTCRTRPCPFAEATTYRAPAALAASDPAFGVELPSGGTSAGASRIRRSAGVSASITPPPCPAGRRPPSGRRARTWRPRTASGPTPRRRRAEGHGQPRSPPGGRAGPGPEQEERAGDGAATHGRSSSGIARAGSHLRPSPREPPRVKPRFPFRRPLAWRSQAVTISGQPRDTTGGPTHGILRRASPNPGIRPRRPGRPGRPPHGRRPAGSTTPRTRNTPPAGPSPPTPPRWPPRPPTSDYDRTLWRRKLAHLLEGLPATEARWPDLLNEANALGLEPEAIERASARNSTCCSAAPSPTAASPSRSTPSSNAHAS